MLSTKSLDLVVELGKLVHSHGVWCQRKREAEKAVAAATTAIASHEAKIRDLADQLAQALREVE